MLQSAGTTVAKTPFRSPNLQAHVERAIQTLKHEVLNAFVVVSERHLNSIVREFLVWYNRERPHTARNHLPPAWDRPPPPAVSLKSGDVVCTTRLGGHLKSYARRAA